MQAEVIWDRGLTFTGGSDSGYEITLGADPGVGGDDDGFRPMELLAIGIIGCTAMDVISILKKKRQDISSFSVELDASRAEDYPKVFTDIKIRYRLAGKNIDPVAVERAIELSETKYCPAHAMFREIVPINLEYEIEEEG